MDKIGEVLLAGLAGAAVGFGASKAIDKYKENKDSEHTKDIEHDKDAKVEDVQDPWLILPDVDYLDPNGEPYDYYGCPNSKRINKLNTMKRKEVLGK